MQTYVVYFFTFVLFALVICLAALFPFFIDELSKARERRKFRLGLAKTIASGDVSWKQVRVLADRYHLSQRGLSVCLTRLIADALEEKEGLTKQQAASFETYYDQVQKDEPFDGIPNDVRFHLERVRERLGDSDDLLRPLAKQLQDLSARNRAKERNMWIISVLSLLAGVIGVVLGAMPLVGQSNDSLASSPSASISTQQSGTTVKSNSEPIAEQARKK